MLIDFFAIGFIFFSRFSKDAFQGNTTNMNVEDKYGKSI